MAIPEDIKNKLQENLNKKLRERMFGFLPKGTAL